MTKIHRRFAPLVYGLIQAAITTAIATAIATYQGVGFGVEFPGRWATAWGLAWLTMLPVVVGVAPLIQKMVLAMTAAPDRPGAADTARR